MNITYSLRRVRVNSGISLRRIAAGSGVGASSLSNIEGGRREPTSGTVERIADALGVRVAVIPRVDRLTAADKTDTQRIPPGGTPGYAVTDVRCGWRVKECLSVVAAVENVLDKDYRIHGSGSNEPGRNFILSAEYRF